MAQDKKISGLTPAAAVLGINEFAINESGTSKKVTATQISTFVSSSITTPPGVTVGPSGADFTTVKGAVDASNFIITVIGNVTETADIILSASHPFYDIKILAGVIWDIATFPINFGVSNQSLEITGPGELTGADPASSNEMISDNGFSSCFFITNNLKLVNNSTALGKSICSTFVECVLKNSFFSIPNFQACGFTFSAGPNKISGCTFEGGGTGCFEIINGSNMVMINNEISGQFHNSEDVIKLSSSLGVIINGLTITGTVSSGTMEFLLGGHVSNVRSRIAPLDILIIGADSIFSDIDGNSGDVFQGQNVNSIHASNIRGFSLVSAFGTSSNWILTNINCSLCALVGDDHSVTNVSAVFSMSVNGDRTQINNCRVQNGSNGEININPTANNTIVSNSFTEVSIVDNGTNSHLSNNVVI